MDTVLKAIQAVETLVSLNTEDSNTASELGELKNVDYTNTETAVELFKTNEEDVKTAKFKTNEGDVNTAIEKFKTTEEDVKTAKFKTNGGDVKTAVEKLKTAEEDVNSRNI